MGQKDRKGRDFLAGTYRNFVETDEKVHCVAGFTGFNLVSCIACVMETCTNIFRCSCDELHKRNGSTRYGVVNTKLELTDQIGVQ